MKKRINMRLILIAVIAVIATMICMAGVYFQLFQSQVRKDLCVSAKMLADTGLFDRKTSQDLQFSDRFDIGEDLD